MKTLIIRGLIVAFTVSVLVTAFSWLIWIGVAAVIIYNIFVLAMSYISAVNGALNDIQQ